MLQLHLRKIGLFSFGNSLNYSNVTSTYRLYRLLQKEEVVCINLLLCKFCLHKVIILHSVHVLRVLSRSSLYIYMDHTNFTTAYKTHCNAAERRNWKRKLSEYKTSARLKQDVELLWTFQTFSFHFHMIIEPTHFMLVINLVKQLPNFSIILCMCWISV